MSIFSQVENKQLELKKEYTKNILKTVRKKDEIDT